MSRLVFWHLTLIFDHVTLNRNHLLSRTNQCTKLSKYQAKYSLNIEQAIQMSEIQQCDSDLSPHHSKNVHASNNPQNVQSQSLSTGNSLSPHLNPSHSHVCINPSYIFSITKREIHILIYPCSKHAYIQQKEDNSFKFILCLKHLKFISWQQLYIYLLKKCLWKECLGPHLYCTTLYWYSTWYPHMVNSYCSSSFFQCFEFTLWKTKKTKKCYFTIKVKINLKVISVIYSTGITGMSHLYRS